VDDPDAVPDCEAVVDDMEAEDMEAEDEVDPLRESDPAVVSLPTALSLFVV
jgi:hypothetical protein